jgi:hypothetical protein
MSGDIDLKPTAVSMMMGKNEIRKATRILGMIPTPNQTKKSGAKDILGTVWKKSSMGVMKRSKLGEAVIAIAIGIAIAIARKYPIIISDAVTKLWSKIFWKLLIISVMISVGVGKR